MHKEMVKQNGRHITTLYHAERVIHVAPGIAEVFMEEGIRYYRDPIGGIHNADLYDKAFGSRNPRAILPKRKQPFQRIRKL